MSEALVGVAIGGLIASVSPLAKLYVDQRRWRAEKRIEFLREERARYEKIFDDTYPEIQKGFAEGEWSIQSLAKFSTALPKSVTKELYEYLEGEDKSDEKKKSVQLGVVIAMQNYLSSLDEKIRDAIEKA